MEQVNFGQNEKNIQFLYDNYLDFERLDLFLDAIPKLKTYRFRQGIPPKMRPRELQMYFKIMFYCCLRSIEGAKLIKSDFDLDHRILILRSPKTNKKGFQKTTLPPPLLEDLEFFLDYKKDNEILFPIAHSTIWNYCKQAGEIANLKIFEELENRSIEGMFSHIFRKSYAKFMEDAGAGPSLIMLKGRWKPHQMYQFYTRPSLVSLIKWEMKIFSKPLMEYRTVFK